MNIGYDAKRLFHNRSGLGNYSRSLLRNIHAFSNYKLYLFSPDIAQSSYKEFKAPPFYSVEGNKFFWRTYFINRDLKRHEIDIFHGLSHEIPHCLHIPSIVTMHDVIFKRYQSDFSWIDRQIYQYKWNYAVENANIVHAISKKTAEDLVKFFAVPAKKIRVIPLSFLPKKNCYSQEKLMMVERYQLNLPYVFYVGDLGGRKNISLILKMYANCPLEKRGKLPLFYIISKDKKELQKLELMAQELAIGRWVRSFSDIDDETLALFYLHAIALIYPSLYEGFGLPVLEGMSHGTPVITSRDTVMEEVGGEAAQYIDPTSDAQLLDVVLELSENSQLRKNMINKGLQRAKAFHPEYITPLMLELYSELIK